MVKERYSNIWLNQTIVSDQSELTILLCQPMNSLLIMKTTLPWYSSLQLLPSYIYDPWFLCSLYSAVFLLKVSCMKRLFESPLLRQRIKLHSNVCQRILTTTDLMEEVLFVLSSGSFNDRTQLEFSLWNAKANKTKFNCHPNLDFQR